MQIKPGYKTTEFAATVLTSLAALVAALAGQLSPRYAAIASAVAVGLYAVSRGLAKATAPAVLPVAPTTVVPPQV